MSNNIKFNKKIEELKEYLIESSDKIQILSDENERLKKEIKSLSEKYNKVSKGNEKFITNNVTTQIIISKISKENIYKIIESLFTKTFDENTYDTPLFWSTYVNYYNDRKDIITLLRFVDAKIPNELEDITLPHEWNEELLDKFFDTMYAHYNCNGATYEDNLRFWTYQMAAHPFSTEYFSCYDEIPWQFVLRNPLLNSKKYAVKIAKEMNNDGNGIYFSKICDYQELDQDVLQTIINNLVVDNEVVAKFLFEHIEFVTNRNTLDELYNKYNTDYMFSRYVLQMPLEYQIRYVKILSNNPEKMIKFLNTIKISKEEKTDLLKSLLK